MKCKINQKVPKAISYAYAIGRHITGQTADYVLAQGLEKSKCILLLSKRSVRKASNRE